MKDPNFKDRVNAMHLAAEIDPSIVRLYDSRSALLSKLHALPRYSSLTQREGTTGARLVLKKKSPQQSPEAKPQQDVEHYDELDYPMKETMTGIESEISKRRGNTHT